jgi:hypothetical protein
VALLKQIKGVGTLIALTFLLTLEDPHPLARVAMWAATSGCSRDGETQDRASRRCTSAKKVIRIYERSCCKARSIS